MRVIGSGEWEGPNSQSIKSVIWTIIIWFLFRGKSASPIQPNPCDLFQRFKNRLTKRIELLIRNNKIWGKFRMNTIWKAKKVEPSRSLETWKRTFSWILLPREKVLSIIPNQICQQNQNNKIQLFIKSQNYPSSIAGRQNFQSERPKKSEHKKI